MMCVCVDSMPNSEPFVFKWKLKQKRARATMVNEQLQEEATAAARTATGNMKPTQRQCTAMSRVASVGTKVTCDAGDINVSSSSAAAPPIWECLQLL